MNKDFENPLALIVGSSRSGTTMLADALGRNTVIHSLPELHFFEQQLPLGESWRDECWSRNRLRSLLLRLKTTTESSLFTEVRDDQYSTMTDDILDQLPEPKPLLAYLAFLNRETELAGKSLPCEQTPRYIFCIHEILAALPKTKIVNMYRDPRDVLLSQKYKYKRRGFGSQLHNPLRESIRTWSNYHPYTITKIWKSANEIALALQGDPRMVSVRYEDLVSEPDRVLRSICLFLEVEFSESMLDVPRIGSSTRIDDPAAVGIDATNIGKWRKGGLSRTEIAICQAVAGETMKRLGYQEVSVGRPLLGYFGSFFVFVAKSALALALNVRRSRTIAVSIWRRLGPSAGARATSRGSS